MDFVNGTPLINSRHIHESRRLTISLAICRRFASRTIALPTSRLGHPHPGHLNAARRSSCRQLFEHSHDTEQPQESCESGTEEVKMRSENILDLVSEEFGKRSSGVLSRQGEILRCSHAGMFRLSSSKRLRTSYPW